MPRKRKCWSKIVEEQGVAVRVYERTSGGVLYVEVRQGGTKKRSSLKHRDRGLGERQAREAARRIAELRHAVYLGSVTLGQLFSLYFAHRGPLMSETRRKEARAYATLFRALLGDAFRADDFGQTQVDRYVAARRSGVLRREKAPQREGVAVRDDTIANEVRWLSSVYNWALGFKQGGKRLVAENPVRLLTVPRERNVRRPVASEDRYRRTLARAEEADPGGRLRCMLALARHTGRRETAICSLRASDLLLTAERVAQALAAAGEDEALAAHMPHGAVRWDAAFDKLGHGAIAPLSRAARLALDAYLREHPTVGDAWLFPAPRDAARPVTKHVAGYWLMKAERLAGVPKLERGRWHPYRRAWASERKHLPDVDVAEGGGWRDTRTLKRSYQRPDAATVLRVVENAPPGPIGDTPTAAIADASSA